MAHQFSIAFEMLEMSMITKSNIGKTQMSSKLSSNTNLPLEGSNKIKVLHFKGFSMRLMCLLPEACASANYISISKKLQPQFQSSVLLLAVKT